MILVIQGMQLSGTKRVGLRKTIHVRFMWGLLLSCLHLFTRISTNAIEKNDYIIHPFPPLLAVHRYCCAFLADHAQLRSRDWPQPW